MTLELTEQGARDGALIIRTARKTWECDGNGAGPSRRLFAEDCWDEITPGFRYLEVLWGAPAYASGSHVCEACARQFYVDWVVWR